MTGFANLSEVMAARAGEGGPPVELETVVTKPEFESTDGHWACYLWQTFRGTWQDVADALDMPFSSTYRQAQTYARGANLAWPLEKRIGSRIKVREIVRGT